MRVRATQAPGDEIGCVAAHAQLLQSTVALVQILDIATDGPDVLIHVLADGQADSARALSFGKLHKLELTIGINLKAIAQASTDYLPQEVDRPKKPDRLSI